MAEWWAAWLGIELNTEKRELASSKTRHLGFMVDLRRKLVMVTSKHRRKFVAFFDRFLMTVRTLGSIRVRDLQKMLGLQIWISTVFRVMRQFLTSTCDILRVSQHCSYFFPRRHKELVSRVVFDLKHWRRFILKAPGAKFSYVLNRLPENHHSLSSDASSSYGMAGVIQFSPEACQQTGKAGLFWQMTWSEWNVAAPIAA